MLLGRKQICHEMLQVFYTLWAQRWTQSSTTWCRCATVGRSATLCAQLWLRHTANNRTVRHQRGWPTDITGRCFTGATRKATSATRRRSTGGRDRQNASEDGRCHTTRWRPRLPAIKRWRSQSVARCQI